MSGYGGPDDESLHAIVLSENGIAAARSMLVGPVLSECQDCGEDIAPARVEFMRQKGMRCLYCIHCQPKYDKAPKVRMLDNIL